MGEQLPEQKRPGGPVNFKPIAIGDVFYHPDFPPKIYTSESGETEYRGGKTISRDEAYSIMFWQQHQPDGLKEAMIENIQNAIKLGEIGHFVAATKTNKGFDIEQSDKEKLSAYRILAKEIGYEIGPYKVNERSGNVTAKIKKIEE